MDGCVRVVECGGQGPRVVDVREKEVIFCAESKWKGNVDWLFDFAQQQLPENTKAVIYSVAGIVKGHIEIVTCPNVHFLDGVLLRHKKGDIPSFACNDMESSITGMADFFPQLNYFMGITRSTGIGVRIWKNGEILSDSEGGHMCVDPSWNAPVCGCGKQGCAEAILGGNAITKFVVKKMKTLQIKIPEGIHPCQWLDACFNKREAWAVNYYELVLLPAFGIFLANIQTLLHLPAIVWKGTLGLKAFSDIPQLEGLIRLEMKKRIINPAWVDDLKFYFLDCPKDHEAYIGAAKIALNLLG
jgi:predicted NBD/HSP70 family sugar kinase